MSESKDGLRVGIASADKSSAAMEVAWKASLVVRPLCFVTGLGTRHRYPLQPTKFRLLAPKNLATINTIASTDAVYRIEYGIK